MMMDKNTSMFYLYSPVGRSHGDGCRCDWYDERCGGQHHRVNWRLLRLRSAVVCSSASHPRHQPVTFVFPPPYLLSYFSSSSQTAQAVYCLVRTIIMMFFLSLQGNIYRRHFLCAGWSFRDRKWLYFLQSKYRRPGNHKGNTLYVWGFFFYSLFTFSVFMLPALYLKRCFKSLNWFSRWAAGV